MSQRLLIITDSLGAPRRDPEMVMYSETWPCIVKQAFEKCGYDTFLFTENGLNSEKLLEFCKNKLVLYEPTKVIIQVGIVDCAPRILKPGEIKLLSILRLSKIVQPLLRKYHRQFSELRKYTYVSIDKFAVNLDRVKQLFASIGAKVVFVEIASPNSSYVLKSPSIQKNVTSYNDILKKLTTEVNPVEYSKGYEKTIFMTDHHHLNIDGHKLLADAVLRSVSK